MSQPIWLPPNLEQYTCKPMQRYQTFPPKQKILIWLVAVFLTWLMGLGVVKLSLILYALLR